MFSRAALVVALGLALAAGTGSAANALARTLDEPKVPEQVASYFATGLVPRLADIYDTRAGGAMAYDDTAKIGTVHRVLAWTSDFLRGVKSDPPTELTNNWVAAVTTADGTVAGLATVWINPASDLPELADYSRGTALADSLAAAPKSTVLVRDDQRSAWFATDGATLTPLVVGSSGVAAPTTPIAYQRLLTLSTPKSTEAEPNQGLVVAVVALGGVVILLAIFVLLPNRRRPVRVAGVPDAQLAVAEPAVANVVAAKVVAARVAVAHPAGTKQEGTKPAGTRAAGTKGAGMKAAGTRAAETKAAPTKAAPTKAAPTKAAPTKAAPTKAAPTKAAPTKAAGTKVTGTNAAGTTAAVTKMTGTKAAATKPPRTNAPAAKSAGTKAAPTKAAGPRRKPTSGTGTPNLSD